MTDVTVLRARKGVWLCVKRKEKTKNQNKFQHYVRAIKVDVFGFAVIV